MIFNYFVFIENLFVVNVWVFLMMKMRGRFFYECMKWDNKQFFRFYVIDCKIGKVVVQYKMENFFLFYYVNVFEIEMDIIMDVCCYFDVCIVYQYYFYYLCFKGEYEVSKGFFDLVFCCYCLFIFKIVLFSFWQRLFSYLDG